MFNPIIDKSLVWLPEKGMGYFPVEVCTYDQEYFKKYAGYADTEVGKQITKERIKFVGCHYSGEIVDVGVGCGQFIEMRGKAKGYDVNPTCKQWLKERRLWRDIYDGCGCIALTFWDSLEHIKNIAQAIAQARKFIFVSMPIFENCDHVLRSKHYRKDEHYWYFTERGLVRWFDEQGFELIERSTMEQDFGRENIMTYAFRRRNA